MAETGQSVSEKAENELSQISRDLAEQTSRMKSSSNDTARGMIVSPVAGTVEQLMFRTPGSAIPAGAPIMTIIPREKTRQVEASVQPRDIDVIIKVNK